MEELRASGLAPKREKPIVEEVNPYDDLLWVWNAFWRLSISRPQGMNGPLRLPPSEIKALADLHGWSQDKQRDFIYYVDIMDEQYMTLVVEEQAKQQDRREAEQRANARRKH